MEKVILTAKLISSEEPKGTFGAFRRYKLSHRIKFRVRGDEIIPVDKLLPKVVKDDLTEEELSILRTQGVEYIGVSDAYGFDERFVFAYYGLTKTAPHLWMRVADKIDGKITMSIHGGDKRSVKPDAVYMRRLASINGMIFGGITDEV